MLVGVVLAAVLMETIHHKAVTRRRTSRSRRLVPPPLSPPGIRATTGSLARVCLLRSTEASCQILWAVVRTAVPDHRRRGRRETCKWPATPERAR